MTKKYGITCTVNYHLPKGMGLRGLNKMNQPILWFFLAIQKYSILPLLFSYFSEFIYIINILDYFIQCDRPD